MKYFRAIPLLFGLFAGGCMPCGDVDGIEYYQASVLLLQPGGSKPLFDRPMVGNYRLDSVRVLDAQQRNVRLTGQYGFSIDFPTVLATDNQALGVDLQKQYLVYLTHTDQDTIDLRYRLRRNDCGWTKFDRLQIHYNGQSIYDGTGGGIERLQAIKRL